MKLSSISFLRLEPNIYEIRSTTGMVLGRIKLREVARPDEEFIDESGPNWRVIGGSSLHWYLAECVSAILMAHNVT